MLSNKSLVQETHKEIR